MTDPRPPHVLAACGVLLLASLAVAALDVSRPGPWVVASAAAVLAAVQARRWRASRPDPSRDSER